MMLLDSYKYGGGGGGGLYSGIAGAFSLRKFNNWANCILQIERSSDSATAYVFIDGASAQDEVSTSSYISTTSETTPSTTTLSTWLSTDNAVVNRWYFQEITGTVDRYIDETGTNRPTFATAGVINTKNGKSCISFNGSQRLKRTSPSNNYSELGNSVDWTCISVSNNDSAGSNPFVMSTSITSTSFASIFNSRHSAARAARILHSGTNYFADLTAQVDSANQRIITMVRNSTNIVAYYNGTLQNTTAHSSAAYIDNSFQIASYWGGNNSNTLTGSIQELIIVAEATPSNLGDMHTDIDTYYSIP